MEKTFVNSLTIKSKNVFLEVSYFIDDTEEDKTEYYSFKTEEFELDPDLLDQLSKVESVSICYLTGDDIIGQDIDWGTFDIDNPLALRVDRRMLKELVTTIIDQIH